MKQLMVPVALGVICLAVAISVAQSWRVERWLAGAGGSIVVLYALALVLFGTEDVGGPFVSVPAGLLLAAFGAWNVRSAFVAGRRAA